MKEMPFLKVEDPVVEGDILFNATGFTLWPNIWDLRQYALPTPRSWLNPKYGPLGPGSLIAPERKDISQIKSAIQLKCDG